jgi:hypothetical protein
MSRQPELDQILQAWYDWEGCATPEKSNYRDILNGLLDKARAGTH